MPENQENQKNFNISESEEEILKSWQENKIFEKSLAQKSPRGDFIFYDGPPFATGLPHYGHILASIIKDAVLRYKTMNGWRAPRRWGWDCHGLPIENLVEKELKLETKKDIEKFGLEKFNEAARESVFRYADEWKKIIPRIGRWVDMENDYRTMDADYTESVWWVFKTLYDKGLIYEGYKSMHICPRCETTLANFEVAQGYKDIADLAITAKFELEEESGIFILAWTTTAWTLPGNAALAVNKNFDYVKIRIKNNESRIKNEFYILAKERLKIIKEDYEIIEEFKGKDLIGKKYKPLFDYYLPADLPAEVLTKVEASAKEGANNKNLKNRRNGWKIYGADFVAIDEGTGIVHIAPAFGEDDMELGKKENLPFIQHVGMDGKFKAEITDFAGMPVKPKNDHQKTDIEILKYLAAKNLIFAKEKIIHSYPHCWRCETPLLNYAASSWFVKVLAIKDELLKINRKINWIPKHLRDGRFGKWLEGARDWAISRSRFWGAPIPVWRCQTDKIRNPKSEIRNSCNKQIIIGSLDEFKKYSKKSGNKYFVMRHGESEANVSGIINSKIENNHIHLTEKGKKEAVRTAEKLKEKNIDLIFASDFLRTKETAEIVAEALGLEKEKIVFDERLREINFGIFDGRSSAEYHNYFSSSEERFVKAPSEGENLTELKNRITEFLYEVEKKYSHKNILFVSHEYPIWLLFTGAIGADVKKAVKIKNEKGDDFIKTAEFLELDFTPLPHNQNYELDFHRPFIDEAELECGCGGKMRRIPEVFDCWFESGAMPFAQAHFPFAFAQNQKLNLKNQNYGNLLHKLNFPAEFIAEGVDQTRGWFYNLLVISAALFGKTAFKNAVANGIILAEDGQKMSKRLKNYPDPMEVVEKYGADSLRFYLLSSPAVRGESLNFSEKGADEVHKKVVSRLKNVLSFYRMYADENHKSQIINHKKISNNILDKWILARMDDLAYKIAEAMDNYEIDKAVRPIDEFIDDLSTWYVRRSRERFKEDGKKEAMSALRYVLANLSLLIAPFLPFLAEEIHQALKDGKMEESVHLEQFPIGWSGRKVPKDILERMAEARILASLGLEARVKARIKVRQPLASLKIKNQKSKIKNKKELLELIKDELNVKEVIFDKNINGEVELDTKITSKLKEEGIMRELTRKVQEMRKKAGLAPQDKIEAIIFAGESVQKIIKKHQKPFQKNISARSLKFGAVGKDYLQEELALADEKIKLSVKVL